MSGSDLPIALRSVVDFLPVRGSIFDDPGDEKSWHVSQRSESLDRFYEGREPSWYSSAITPLAGARRVLDLGCGPGLALQALLNQGSSSVVGIDRWPAFTANSTPAAPIVAHDLTLPMPFLKSGMFDAVLSHYALDYISPIGMRQVLREAHRVLVPSGRLLIYVAAVGMGSGDEARTAAYSPSALRALLAEVGFEEITVEASPNGRNSVARARNIGGAAERRLTGSREVEAAIEGDLQLSASFDTGVSVVNFVLSSARRSVTLSLDFGPSAEEGESRISVCARVQRTETEGTELQVWAWRGHVLVVSECARFELAASNLRIDVDASVEHVSVWTPGELPVEPSGNAHARFGDLPPGGNLSEAERGAEGRQVVVESPGDVPVDVGKWLGPGHNRFVIRRGSGIDLSTIDREWIAGRAYGIAYAADELDGGLGHELLLWAGWRQALVFIDGPDWEGILAAALRRQAELGSPLVLIDPVLSCEARALPLPSEVAAFAGASNRVFALLGKTTRNLSLGQDLELHSRRLLYGGPVDEDEAGAQEANETLRHLTERTVLMRLRQAHGRSLAEIGRRPAPF